MIKWFESNPLGMTLASICGGLLLISLLIAVVWALPPSVPASDAEREKTVLALNVPELDDSEPLETYTVITDRPVFNLSRLPIIEEEPEEDSEEEPEEQEVDAPELELAGVIITPSIRMVTLRPAGESESLVAFEDQPLEGNYGTWRVSQIKAREVTLSSASGEELQLELLVHDATIAEPPKSTAEESAESPATAEQAKDADSDQPLSRAEEIRQRIAERRQELRQAAENKEQDQEPEMDYRTAIQSMVSGSKRKQEKDEDEK